MTTTDPYTAAHRNSVQALRDHHVAMALRLTEMLARWPETGHAPMPAPVLTLEPPSEPEPEPAPVVVAVRRMKRSAEERTYRLLNKRVRVRDFLYRHGKQSLGDLREATRSKLSTMTECLCHPWFERDGEGFWGLSQEGRRASERNGVIAEAAQ